MDLTLRSSVLSYSLLWSCKVRKKEVKRKILPVGEVPDRKRCLYGQTRTDQYRIHVPEIPAHQQSGCSQKQMARLPQSLRGTSRAGWCLPVRCMSVCQRGHMAEAAAGRGEEGSSAPEADVNLPMRSCKGQMGYSAFLYRFDWETKHELATSCLQRKKLLFQQFCEHCYGSFQR